jgi:CRP/FNR family cyclic AMP-dependent transcriptional regulator
MPCNAQDLSTVRLFELLDEDELAQLASVIDSEKFEAEQTVFNAGDVGDELYIVNYGEIELSIRDTAGQKIVLKVAGEDDIFGEISMLDNRPRSATAVALAETELFVLDRDDLLLLFQKKPDAGLNMLAAMGDMLRETDKLLRTRVSRNVNEEMEERQPALVRIADWIAWFSGSMAFLIINGLWFLVWIGANTLPPVEKQFDPFPFGLLTMIVSLEAIFLSCFVLISQNRQAAKDKIRSDIEYDVNIKAELEVAHLHEKVDHLHEQMVENFAKLGAKVGGRGKSSSQDV